MIQETKGQANLRIGVIGAGVAGLTAAWLLQKKHEVVLFEENSYLGGHTHTISIPDGPDAGTPVDTGFIVYNAKNYPSFIRLLDKLGIQGQSSDMSFGFYSRKKNLMYNSYVPKGLFAQKLNVFRPSFLLMVRDILRFNKQATADLAADAFGDMALGAYLDKGNYSRAFRDYYIIPMGAAIWSTPLNLMLDFPVSVFMRFFHNHGLLALEGRPQWLTVQGGSRTYVDAMLKGFRGRALTGRKIRSVKRNDKEAVVVDESGEQHRFDYVVIGTHADQALKILENPSPEEQELLGAWSYHFNTAVLHTDETLMPPLKNAWASWNYIVEPEADASAAPVSLTYHMNRLQSLKTARQYFVTLNTSRRIPAQKVIREMSYTHPMYDRKSLDTQKKLSGLNGKNRTFYCGSYFGYGFHEDAVKSSFQAVSHFGVEL